MPRKVFILPLASVLMTAGFLAADQPLPLAKTLAALTRLRALRPELGLDQQHDFQPLTTLADTSGLAHVRFRQRFLGVPVWGGEAITHANADGSPLPLTDALYRNLSLSVLPSLTPSEALALAQADLTPRGPYAYPPVAALVIYPITRAVPDAMVPAERRSATDSVRQVQRYALAYHVHTQLENGTRETAHTDYLIDAHTGVILKKWDTLRTSAAIGQGVTQYSGTVPLNTTRFAKGFQLRDQTRGHGGMFHNNVVTNLDHGSTGTGSLYNDSDNTWGNSANYLGSSEATTSPTGQTAAADAAYGLQVTWDMYQRVFHRNGIDGTGKATYSRVHYGTSYDNAFWDDLCFCMTYGDGDAFTSLEAIDVAGHEISHGVCANSANLEYSGESGGLNEANSDIFGTLAEFYAKGGGFAAQAATIPKTGGNWTLGEQLASSPLRYMYRPSLDGTSPDAWTSDLADQDVHYSSGPMNRCFYFLSQGASATPGDYHSSYLPSGMTGLGNDLAAKIWYRALTAYLTSSSDYAAARTATIRAAKDLKGAGSAAEQAVWNAFHGINVGPAWKGTSTNTVTAKITLPAGDLTLPSGATQAFAGSAKDSDASASLTYVWDFGDSGSATGTSASHLFLNPGPANAVYRVAFTATDNTGASGTASRTLTILPGRAPGPDLIVNGGFEQGSTGWTGDTEVVGAFKTQPPYEGTRNAFFGGWGATKTEQLYQAVTIPAKAGTATLSFYLHISTGDLPGEASDVFRVQILNSQGTLLKELATYSNEDAADGYALRTFDLAPFRGQTVRINFTVTEDWFLQTSFVVDQVSLIAP